MASATREPRSEHRAPASTSSGGGEASFGPALLLTVTLAFACFLVVMPLVLLVVHPQVGGLGADAKYLNQQSQNAKTALYLGSFAIILPLALIWAPRLADRVRRGANSTSLPAIAGGLAGGLAVMLLAVRLSAHLPWGAGVGPLLAGALVWWILAGLALRRAIRRPWKLFERSPPSGRLPALAVWGLAFGAVLCVTHVSTLTLVPLVVGALLVLGLLALGDRIRLPKLARWQLIVVDVVALILVLLAVPNVVIYHSSSGPPGSIFQPGIIQFQQDWIIGPANQLRGGGALLVNSPSSQYGVGMLYFLAGWFHLAPIGYGTFGLLDGILTALFYATGYCVLRLAGVGRLLAGSALALGVVAFLYDLVYAVGALPEQGPLRFGPPIALIVFAVAAARWPGRSSLWRAAAFAVLGVASVWALEAFAYTALTFVAIVAMDAWLREPADRLRYGLRQLGLGAATFIAAHAIFALATLAGSGHLPDWGQYLAFIHELLLGGREGSITYGFDNWSPGLALGAACLASAAAIVMLVRRAPAVAAAERPRMIALTGCTAFAIAVFSYTDNRSSTYLLLYVALPILLAATLWLDLLLRSRSAVSRSLRRGGLAFCLSVALLLIAAAWPQVGAHFRDSALAHAYPSGGLHAALVRLWHSPTIDPRAPDGERLLARYIPGKRAMVVLTGEPDLAIEILMRSKRTNSLFIGDPNMDGFVPSVWIPKIRRELAQLRPGDRLLTDTTAAAAIAFLRAHPRVDPLKVFTAPGSPQLNWILRELDKRFVLRPIQQDPNGLVVAQLVART